MGISTYDYAATGTGLNNRIPVNLGAFTDFYCSAVFSFIDNNSITEKDIFFILKIIMIY